ncbi:MAG: GTP cyclohydrolase II [Parachlamydiales bacterium]|nr:GTP cyclohydrolase II [Parachlamydiales bacterium]
MLLTQQKYAETKITTKFGEFNIRVYENDQNQETIVLWTNGIDKSLPVLVRVHSECITGDLFGSLHCDCGKQLTTSLKLIKDGGIFIYLRQEGRGIGLFEKIKAYQLQSQGYDTVEANVLLGHNPDERSYEMVKKVLEDLEIKKIRLITNNPAKISGIAKLGIEITERIPIIISPNKYNKKYYLAKQNKFQHFFKDKMDCYYYQIPIEKPDHIVEIIRFLKEMNHDPLLNICVGISANTNSLEDQRELDRIKNIFQICHFYEKIIPVLHFSFKNSQDPFQDIEIIKRMLPFVRRLQINDWQKSHSIIAFLQYVCDLFYIDIPLSDENFDNIHNKKFRNKLKNHSINIVLDNSHGKGISESKESFMNKINILLNYGLNNITLSGGFGPDNLDVYFFLRRYYQINFSIDAETKLKTGNHVSIEKIKRFLFQLIRFDDPKKNGVDQTKKFIQKIKHSLQDKVYINNIEFFVFPHVFHPGFFPSSAWFAAKISKIVEKDKTFCEIGCGSGIISCSVALANPQIYIVSTDISKYAEQNTIFNSQKLNIQDRVTVFKGDVLENIPQNYYFDCISWVLPFGYLDPGTYVTLEEKQVFDPGYVSIRKFFQTAKQYLNPGGKLLIGFSSELGNLNLLLNLAKEANISLKVLNRKILKETKEITFELLEGKYLEALEEQEEIIPSRK